MLYMPHLRLRLPLLIEDCLYKQYPSPAISAQPLDFPPAFGALPPPLCFFSGAPPWPPTPGLFGSLIPGLLGLAFNALSLPPCSPSAVASASSGLVLFGLKAASDCAAASSDPDFEYSVDRGTSESLSCASFCAKRVGVMLRKRGVEVEGRVERARRCSVRVGWKRNIVVAFWSDRSDLGIVCDGARSVGSSLLQLRIVVALGVCCCKGISSQKKLKLSLLRLTSQRLPSTEAKKSHMTCCLPTMRVPVTFPT
jgi:hypothetical protein